MMMETPKRDRENTKRRVLLSLAGLMSVSFVFLPTVNAMHEIDNVVEEKERPIVMNRDLGASILVDGENRCPVDILPSFDDSDTDNNSEAIAARVEVEFSGNDSDFNGDATGVEVELEALGLEAQEAIEGAAAVELRALEAGAVSSGSEAGSDEPNSDYYENPDVAKKVEEVEAPANDVSGADSDSD